MLGGYVVSDSATSWTVARQAPLSTEFSRQDYWSGLPCPPPRDLPNSGIEPRSPESQADSLPPEPPGKPRIPRRGILFISLVGDLGFTQRTGGFGFF